jgi:ribulose-5-phosphate 4-epimerase/fuculose-1-phosphate aldolase
MTDPVMQIKAAAARLRDPGIMRVGDSMSQRLAGTDQIIFLTLETSPGEQVEMMNVISVIGSIPDGLHHATLREHQTIYQFRKDVGAILTSRQPWACALRDLKNGMPGVFDEQIRHLGNSVPCADYQGVSKENCAFIGKGENAFVLESSVLCLGMTSDRLVFNAELLEKCAKAYVLASSTGRPVSRIPWLVRWIANGRLMKDERYAAQQYALGLVPVFKSAY